MKVKTGTKRKTVRKSSMKVQNSLDDDGSSSVKSSGVGVEVDSEPWIADMKDDDVHKEWTCLLTFMLETDIRFHGVMNLINSSLASCKRRAVRVISFERIQQMVLDHCFKTGERTPFSALCEQIKMTAGPRFQEKIPVDLLAYMVKYIILYERKYFLREKKRKAKLKYRAGARYVALALKYELNETFPMSSEEENEVDDGKGEGEDEEEEEEEEEVEVLELEQEVVKEVEIKVEEESVKKKGKSKRKSKVQKNSKEKSKSALPVKEEREEEKKKKKKKEEKKKEEEKEDSVELERALEDVEHILDENVKDYKRRKMEEELMKKLQNIPKEKLWNYLKKYLYRRKMRKSKTDEKHRESEKGAVNIVKEDVSLSTQMTEEGNTFVHIKDRYHRRKMDTLLHRRGEPVRDMYTFDDSPPKGPDMYIFITSLTDENLPETLAALNVHIDAYLFVGAHMPKTVPRIVDLKLISRISDLTEPFHDYLERYGNHFSFLSAAAIERYASKNYLDASEVYNKLTDNLTNFYTSFFKKVIDLKTYKLFEDVIMTRYLPDITELNLKSAQWIINLADLLYANVSKIAYYFHSIYLLYKKYQRTMKSKDLSIPIRLPESRMRYYKTLLDRVPNEIITIPLILDAIISQVCLNLKVNIGYSIAEYIEKPKRRKQDDKGNILQETIKELRKEYFPNLQWKVHKPVETKFILNGDILALHTYSFGKWGKFIRDRSLHVLEVYFDNQWNKFVPNYDHESEEFNRKHFETLEKACKNMNLKFTKDTINLLLNIMSFVSDNIVISRSSSESGSDMNIRDVAEIKLSATSSSQTIHSNYSELMKALTDLKDKIRYGDNCIDEQLLSLTSTDDSSNKVHKFIEQIRELDGQQIKHLLNILTHYELMPKRLFLQKLWDTIQEYNSVNVKYVPFTHSLIYTCCNESINAEEQGTLPARMSLREFYTIGLDELKDWCNSQQKFINDHHLNGLFFTEMDKVKDKIDKPVRISSFHTLIQWYLTTIPRCYRETMKIIRKNPLWKLRNKYIKPIIRRRKPKVKPSLYYFGSLKRSKLFTNTREFCFNNSTIISFKIFKQMYHTPELTINIKQNGNSVIFHTELSTNNQEKSVLFSHSSGIQIYFYEQIEDKFSWGSMNEEGYYDKHIDYNEEKKLISEDGLIEASAEETEETTNSDIKQFEHTLKDTFQTNKIKTIELDKILEVKDEYAEIGAKFKCKFSYPNGLFVETVESKLDDFNYVKQCYLIHGPGYEAVNNEKSRLFLRNGVVIVIDNEKLLPEIFYPCGRWIKYSKFNYSNLINKDEGAEDVFTDKMKSSHYRDDEELAEDDETVDQYYLFEPDGSCYNVCGEQMTLLEKKRYHECIEILNDTRTILMEDGPTFSYNGDNMMIITFHDGTKITTETDVDDDQVFCDWTRKELRQWFQGEWSCEGEFMEECEGEYVADDYSGSTLPPSTAAQLTKDGSSSKKEPTTGMSAITITTSSSNPKQILAREYSVDISDDRTTVGDLYKFDKVKRDYRIYDLEEDEDGDEEEEVEGREEEIKGELSDESDFQHYYDKIILESDGFLWIKTSYHVEHPYYATVSISPYDDRIVFSLAKDVVIVKHDNGCMDLISDGNLSLSLRYDQIYIDSFIENELLQRSIIYYKVFENHSLDIEPQIVFKSYDKDGNSVIADTSGNINYNPVRKTIIFSADEDSLDNIETINKEIVPTYINDNAKKLIMNENLTGLELFTNVNIERFHSLFTNKCEQMLVYEEEPFITCLYLMPFDNIKIGKWILQYSKMEKQPLFELPSTYGDSWLFPYTPKENIKCNLPELMIVRYINSFKYDNIDVIFQEIIKEYICLLTNFTKRKYKVKQRKKDGCFVDNVINISKVKDEAIALHRVLFNECAVTIIRNGIIVTELYNMRKERETDKIVERKFRFKRKYSWQYFKKKIHDIYNKNYVQYFESGPGVAFLIIDIIIDRVLMVIDILGLKDEIEELLDKPMNELTEENLQHIKMYLELFYEQLPEKKGLNIDRILHAAVKLADYFPNIRHALQLRVNYEGEYTVEEYCKRLKYSAEDQCEMIEEDNKESTDKDVRFLQRTIDNYLVDNCHCTK